MTLYGIIWKEQIIKTIRNSKNWKFASKFQLIEESIHFVSYSWQSGLIFKIDIVV